MTTLLHHFLKKNILIERLSEYDGHGYVYAYQKLITLFKAIKVQRHDKMIQRSFRKKMHVKKSKVSCFFAELPLDFFIMLLGIYRLA